MKFAEKGIGFKLTVGLGILVSVSVLFFWRGWANWEQALKPLGEMETILTSSSPESLDDAQWRKLSSDFLSLATHIKRTEDTQAFNLASYVGLALFLCWFLTRTIVRPIVALLDRIRASATQLRATSLHVSENSKSLADGAINQAASLEESAAALEELSSSTGSASSSSQHALSLCENVRKASEAGSSSMSHMMDAIGDIKSAADETAQIIKIIDEIAFQTNLLALNASVEAARAGDAGKGFAVVAGEVRNLAQRSATAAKETSEKIRRSKALADNGVEVTNDTAKVLSSIKENAEKSRDLVRDMARQSQEQSLAMTQLSQTVTGLDRVTQQNSASAQQSSAAAQELAGQANTLDQVLDTLFTLVRGNALHVEKKPKTANKKISPKVPGAGKKLSNKPSSPAKEKEMVRGLTPSQIIPLDDRDFQGF